MEKVKCLLRPFPRSFAIFPLKRPVFAIKLYSISLRISFLRLDKVRRICVEDSAFPSPRTNNVTGLALFGRRRRCTVWRASKLIHTAAILANQFIPTLPLTCRDITSPTSSSTRIHSKLPRGVPIRLIGIIR